MAAAADGGEILSDLEDDLSPTVLSVSSSTRDVDSLEAVLAELESERQARRAAESAKVELHSTFTRLKTFTQEAVRQRDEAMRHREEALRSKEELAKQLTDVLLRRDEVTKQRNELALQRDDAMKARDEVCRQRDDAIKARDVIKSENESTARLLVAGADRITNKATSVKSFPGSLPRSSSHTGVPAIAYGYTKRAEEIVEELVRHQESAAKSRSDMREQMEKHNYQAAIEASELEASIGQLKGELSQKAFELEHWKKQAADVEGKVSEIEQMALHRLSEAEKNIAALKSAEQLMDNKLRIIKMSIRDLSQLVLKASELAGSFTAAYIPSQTHITNASSFTSSVNDEPEECLQKCVLSLKEAIEVFAKLGMAWKDHSELRKKEIDSLEGTITRLMIEKKEITNFLRSALANKQELLKAVSKSNVDNNYHLNTAIKNWEMKNENVVLHSGFGSLQNPGDDEFKAGEAISMASALENDFTKLRQEIFELQQSLAVARGEVEWLRVTSERQAKEISEKTVKVRDLEDKQLRAHEKIEGLERDLSAAAEEIFRWKQAAAKEAEAGNSLLEEMERCEEQVTVLKERVRQLSQALEEANSKLDSKEEIAAAAIAARSAAEQSLQIADERAVQLRRRIEEMTKQFELLEGMDDAGLARGFLYKCWPYNWFRKHDGTTARPGSEMEELLEPFV